MSENKPNLVRRRGAAIAAMAVVLVLMNLLIIASVHGGVDASEADGMRIETLRAFYAAESGAWATIALKLSAGALPESGGRSDLGLASIEFLEVPAGATGTVVIEGRSGSASRRVTLEFQ